MLRRMGEKRKERLTARQMDSFRTIDEWTIARTKGPDQDCPEEDTFNWSLRVGTNLMAHN